MELQQPSIQPETLIKAGRRVTAAVATLALATAGCSADKKDAGPDPATTAASISPSPVRTPGLTEFYCGIGGLEKMITPGMVTVDGRCDRDAPSAPVGLYEGTKQAPEQAVARAETGTMLVAKCFYDNGQQRSNSNGASSARWIRVELNDRVEPLPGKENIKEANLPAIWTHNSQAVTKPC